VLQQEKNIIAHWIQQADYVDSCVDHPGTYSLTTNMLHKAPWLTQAWTTYLTW
jgi:hypothetical protein